MVQDEKEADPVTITELCDDSQRCLTGSIYTVNAQQSVLGDGVRLSQPLVSQLMTPFETAMQGNHPLRTTESIVLVGIGGFAGSNLRYFVETIVSGPVGTLAVNVVGSFALGFVLYEAMYTDILSERTRVVFATGFLSSLTTYSTFALQTVLLDSTVWMVANVIASYALGLGGVFVGRALARRVDGGSR